MKITIARRWYSSLPSIEEEIGAEFENASDGIKLGAAIKVAFKSGADLRDAVLRGAALRGAVLSGADLRDAKNVGDFTMADGLKFSQYLSDVVPALLTAGGKTIQEIVAAGSWECHSWENCPMHAAFGIRRADDGPPLLRARIKEFVTLFDAGLIPNPIKEGEAA